MVSCNVGLTSALTSLYLFQMPRLGSDIQNLSTGIGLTPSPTRCNIRSDLTVSVISLFHHIFNMSYKIFIKKNINISQGGFFRKTYYNRNSSATNYLESVYEKKELFY